uniref:Uncharacterized protein n=1 Tax=Avena sativa TaxID=4498 RepID=A0ACD5VED1_AVESA
MPVPFNGEMFVLARDGVEFHVDKIPSAPGGHAKTKGTIYLSNIRMVFVAANPVGNFFAFDMPLLYVHGEKFNQPIFHCNNISGFVEPVVAYGQNRALYSTHAQTQPEPGHTSMHGPTCNNLHSWNSYA